MNAIADPIPSCGMGVQEKRPAIHKVDYRAKQTLMRYLQDISEADKPASTEVSSPKAQKSKTSNGKPKLVLMGQRRSGKSSISSVVFHKLPASDTLYLETTTRIKKEAMHSFMDFQVWEFPGHLNYFDPAFDSGDFLAEMGAMIWVIDAQDDYFEAIARLNQTILDIQPVYPNINIEVFVHKVDGLSDDYRLDTYQDIVHRVQDELQDAGYDNAHVSFYQTSIYDHTIFEAFSKVIQKLIPTELAALEALLDSLVARCRIEKAYLFDVLSKIYIAQDTSSKDPGSYEICSDYIDVVVDISEIYGWDRGELADADPEDLDGEENGNQDAESVVISGGSKNNCYLYLKEINKYLALICIMAEDSPSDRKALIDYNVGVFQEAVRKVFPR